ncbi:MAG: hypothetical protein JSV68_22080 [Anaerolineaceae bacterium]|nr:MAG: hypothetical protein JSV68_22080 [Anaerolineaceae bacterium]
MGSATVTLDSGIDTELISGNYMDFPQLLFEDSSARHGQSRRGHRFQRMAGAHHVCW